ncbi:TRAP transporter substrate-binding protein [Azonexus sp.]|uniref:TRAP transporter substrate-binding protein n=1 Tax=Azonexus sp. TaxID=1872668 RepID=UPI0035B43CA2
MQRRDFLAVAAAGAAASLAACGKDEAPPPVAAPTPAKKPAAPAGEPTPQPVEAAAVQGAYPAVRWRLTSSFPRSLDTIFGGAEVLADRLRAMTGGRFDIRVFQGGEIVPGLQAFDAVEQGTVEVAHTCSYYYVGKDKSFGFGTSMPFGMNARQMNAWVYYGGGQELLDDFYGNFNVLSFAGGNTGTQMGGWWRKKVSAVDDLKGIKMRIAGLGGAVFSELGVVPQQIAGGDIYPALERGTIDAAEWVGPYDDERLGFYKVAKNYYYPGWWEPGPMIHFFVNRNEWEKLPREYQEAFRAAAFEANVSMMARYDHQNPIALKKLLQSGVKLQEFSRPILEAAYKAAQQLYADEAKKNPAFKKILKAYDKYRRTENAWFSVAENRMDDFLQSQA